MTRLYDKYGATPCSVCRRHPALGWLYRCTQDTDGSLPRSDFSDDAPRKAGTSLSSPAGPYLSPAALKAISPGQYNNEQDPQMVHQNDAVQNPDQDHTRPTTRSSTAQESMTFSSIPESTTFSTTATSANIDEELQAAYDWPALYKAWEADGSEDLVEHPISACGFRICTACRPTYRDRAMQSIDGVLNNPKAPPKWELDNRRVSDARVLRTIGLPKSRCFNAETVPGTIPAQSTLTSQYLLPQPLPEPPMEEDERQENVNHYHRPTGLRQTRYERLSHRDRQTGLQTLEPRL
ncbi:hypothetical protein DV736_g5506, partial [Chaetothyriales sp. CBS 134916]